MSPEPAPATLVDEGGISSRTGAVGYRIAANALAFLPGTPGGLNRYTDALLSQLFRLGDDVVAYVAEGGAPGWPEERVRRVTHPIVARSSFLGNLSRFAWQQAALPRRLRRDGAQVFYSPVPEGMQNPPIPQVITIHDLLPLRFPASYPRLRHYSKHIVPRLAAASSAIIVDSEATAADVRELYPVRDVPVQVIHPGYDESRFRPVDPERVAQVVRGHGLGRFVLAVGETRPYKNIRRLIAAFASIRDLELDLVVVGAASRHDDSLTALPASLGISARVRFLGAVPDEDLAALYSGAEAFVFPSLFEGFGMPPLEAMACGCPVVASHAASIPEVCGEAALYVDPYSSGEIADAIRRVVEDPGLRDSLKRRGFSQASRFSYRRTAEQVIELLGRVAGSAC